jgi:hypothetical protein
MNTMNNMPGFTAEALLCNTNESYRMTQAKNAALKTEGAVVPQQLISAAPLQHMSESTAVALRRIIVRCTCPCCICVGNIRVCC